MKSRLLAVVAACCAISAVAAWNPGEPVTTYWFGPGYPKQTQTLTETWAKQLRDGGFNTAWASTPEELDVAAKFGLRAIYAIDPAGGGRPKVDLDDPAQKSALAERIERVRRHPALYVYGHYDEPSIEMFEELARVKDFIHRLDPEHAAWVNLLPTYATNKMLGIGGDIIRAYVEHVRLFGEAYRPEFISHDHYQFNNNGDTPNYFLNLGIIRQSAAAQGIPFWNGVQACGWKWSGGRASPNSPRIPGAGELRYCAWTTAAYGAHGIYYFVYCRGGHDGGIAETDGRTGEKYEAMKAINRDFVAVAKALAPLKFKGAYFQGVHSPGTTPYGRRAILKISPETPCSEVVPPKQLEDTTLVSRFEAPGMPVHLAVVNCDHQKDRTLHVRAPLPVERFDTATRKWSPVGDEFDLALLRGGGALLRLVPVARKVGAK